MLTLVNWFLSNVWIGETQLMVGASSALMALDEDFQICDGMPALVSRSATVAPNGACPDVLSAVNASCTCITDFDESATSWEFRVSELTEAVDEFPVAQVATDVLAITSIRTFWVSSAVETL